MHLAFPDPWPLKKIPLVIIGDHHLIGISLDLICMRNAHGCGNGQLQTLAQELDQAESPQMTRSKSTGNDKQVFVAGQCDGLVYIYCPMHSKDGPIPTEHDS